MTVSATSQKTQSAFQKELVEFSKQVGRLGNCLLNRVFDLSVKGAQWRNRMLVTAFIVSGAIFTLSAHPLGDWIEEIGLLFRFLFNTAYAQLYPDTLNQFLAFTFGAIVSPRTLRYLPVFILPFLLALQSAAIYLADIFELDVNIAREFILQVALRGGREKLRIKNGDVVEKDRTSPIFLIGGPGKVLVELDSVALFEKPDGRPHIIDSTKTSNNVLDGFERFRGAIDLRDQFLELSEKENNSVTGRSLDGMQIKATDVRLLYQIRRDNLNPTLERPHPYMKEAVYQLIYNEGRPVITEGPVLQKSKPGQDVLKRSPTGLQMGAIESLIRSELGKFISKYRLARYLASYGMPEYENARRREEAIFEISRMVADPSDPIEPERVPPPPEFETRERITSLFTEFTNEFPQNAKNSGVELHWIGVGTWKPPNDIVLQNHIDAWRISLENLGRGSLGAILGLGQEVKTQKKIQLIQDVPLARFQKDRASGKDTDEIIRDLLFAYREQLVKAKELLEESERPVPEEISSAIEHLDTTLKYIWIGKGKVPPSSISSSNEEPLYEFFLKITGNDRDLVEKLIENERTLAPELDGRVLIRRAIERFLKDNQ